LYYPLEVVFPPNQIVEETNILMSLLKWSEFKYEKKKNETLWDIDAPMVIKYSISWTNVINSLSGSC